MALNNTKYNAKVYKTGVERSSLGFLELEDIDRDSDIVILVFYKR